MIGAVTFSQDIPDVLRPDINVAYTDTDGTGQRADRRAPGAERYYREIDAKIAEVTGVAAQPDRGADRRLQLPVGTNPTAGSRAWRRTMPTRLPKFDKRAEAQSRAGRR